MDKDLEEMTSKQLLEEAKKLRAAIRAHRDTSLHDLCWYHPEMWNLLPESAGAPPVVPEWPQFMQGCIRYRQSLDEQCANAPRTNQTY